MPGMTQVTVALNHKLTINTNGWNYVYEAGDAVYVPNFEVGYLRSAGVIV